MHRASTLAQPCWRDLLVQSWREADAWLVGAYITMPDHLHLFCAPKKGEITMEHWIAFGNGSFAIEPARMHRDSSRAVFIIGSGAAKTRARNGSTFVQIPSVPG